MSWGLGEPDQISLWEDTDEKPTELWSRGYVDEDWPPHMAYVADDGRHVVLRDVYHNLGDGKCLVFLGPQGNVLKAYELEEFLTQDEILKAPMSVSSRWWSEPGWFRLRDEDRQFALVTSRGTVRCFDTATGNRIKMDERLRAEIVAQAVFELKDKLEDAPPRQRAGAATLLGFLGAKECIPQLKEALTSSEITALELRNASLWSVLSGKSETEDPVCGVKLAAAAALIELMGAEALPLIEPEFRKTNGNTRSDLLRIAAGEYFSSFEDATLCRRPEARAFWRRLAGDEDTDVRACALRQLILGDDGEFLRSRPQLLQSELPEVRSAAVSVLCKHVGQEDLPVVRRLFSGADPRERNLALQALIRLAPPDVTELLRKTMADRDGDLRFAAMLQLVRQKDQAAVEKALAMLAELKKHSHQRAGWGTQEMRAAELCELVFETRLKQAVPSLQDAAQNPCPQIQLSTCGVLAGFGNKQALLRLRRFAKDENALLRANAVKWIGLVADHESRPLLERAALEEEPWVRDVAVEALHRLDSR